ncbi:hypothetical protein AGABI1DRAFT_134019 [Agaricus bisporus var. burnettii JB137-S8]|uniref:Starter acyltransferase (SAT) domain-containing protein n=1 Tax=Agaricus bisporus var. burnettii (strain JB137-S8 / ATCC MYA-4627 / FGSC 10392) TaxID=597362 RepID=K5XHD2_AGABU|nr:uncharacterized protein AGABI1DRAFT_134019 [Agaricus bisporus var. burnettii JB137-S8]EKM73825.1 hypothetical protein AGABI1DRAFT_134019 [Agaricus bisporus var. burnettii JB137-S8]
MASPKISVLVSTKTNEWIDAEVLLDEFIHAQTLDAGDASSVIEDAEATVGQAAKFLAHVALNIDNDSQSTEARMRLLLNMLKRFTSSYLATKDIHSLRVSYPIHTHKTVLSACYRTVAALENKASSSVPRQLESALLDAAKHGKASIFALFGGQGTNEVYFNELQSLYDIYQPYVAPFLEAILPDLTNVISWLSGATNWLSVAYLASAPLSLPLIGLTQLIQYLVACRIANLTTGQVRSRIARATGHSQGILSAVGISASETLDDFTENSRKALHWLFYCHLCGQQAFPPVAVEPSLVQDTLDDGEGIPSPVSSVAGLPLKDLEVHIKKTNSHLPADFQLGVSLYNGPRAFIVTGPARASHGLVTNLRKVRVPSGADQSKVPFSQRKPAFSVHFLVVGIPYHSPYLKDATDAVMDEDLDELWEPSELKVSVYNTNI